MGLSSTNIYMLMDSLSIVSNTKKQIRAFNQNKNVDFQIKIDLCSYAAAWADSFLMIIAKCEKKTKEKKQKDRKTM